MISFCNTVFVNNDVGKFHKKLKRLQKVNETNKVGCLFVS